MRSHAKAASAGSTQATRLYGLVGLALLLTGAFVILLGSASAQAAISYKSSGGFGNGALSGSPTRLAVDDASGDVLVVDSPNNRVLVFDSGGGGASLLTEFGAGELSTPYGIAIDQSNGAVYVSDAGNNRVARYTSDGAPTPTYTLDATYASPAQGSAAGEVGSFASPLAIDPLSGDLLVADTGNQRVSRFDSSGAFVSSFNGADTEGGAFTNLLDVTTAESGDIYVLDLAGQVSEIGEVVGTSRVERFSPAGSAEGRIGAGLIDRAISIAYQDASQNLVAATQMGAFGGAPKLSVLHNGALIAEIDYPEETARSGAPGLAFQSGPSGHLYALTSLLYFGIFGGVASVQAFDPVPIAELTLDAPGEVTATSAHFSGTVNPVGEQTKYRFEYRRDGEAAWISTPEEEAGSGESPVAVEASVTGLLPNSKYEVRLEASNSQAKNLSSPQTFSTPAAPPGVETRAATGIGIGAATLRGVVNPFGLQSGYRFEYGLTATYGSEMPTGAEAPAGNGYSPISVEELVTGLQPGTTYHYRLVAENSAGVRLGEDRTFVTSDASAPKRTFEMVSPVDKGGSEVDEHWPHASANGDWIAYLTKTAVPGDLSKSAPLFPRYMSKRSALDWGTVGLDPPISRSDVKSTFIYDVLAVSDDGSRAFVISPKKLAEGAIEGDSNVYLKDVDSGSYTTVATSPGTGFYALARLDPASGSQVVIGGSPDFSRVIFQSEGFSFLPDASSYGVYEWSGAGLRLVASGSTNAGNNFSREPNFISEDGKTIFYWQIGVGISAEVNGSEDVLLPGDEFVGASADGRLAYTSSVGGNLYRYDLSAHEAITIASDLPAGNGGLAVSRDGDYVYYVSQNSIWLWHDGEITHVASLDRNGVDHQRASPNGRFFFFGSSTAVTDFNSEGFEEFYRYDAERDELTCASCRVDGGRPSGSASVGEASAEFEHYIARSVIDSGEVFFDTPDPLVARDVNGRRDVYSFDGTQPTLISSGTWRDDAVFADAGADGRDVFFVTQSNLVSQDIDSAADMYDARLGGGIPSQEVQAGATGCSGAGCRAGRTPALAPFAAGSELVGGAAVRRHPKKQRCGKKRIPANAKRNSRCTKQRKAQGGKRRAHGKGRQAR